MLKTEKHEVETKHHRGRREKVTLGKIISNIVLVLACAVFLFSGYKLYSIFSEYKAGEDEYENIIEDAIIQIESEETTENTEREEVKFIVDFTKLEEINSDVVGWIRFEQPEIISYPVVKGPDNAKYLNTTFEGKRNAAGTLFVDVYNTEDFSDRNTFIYGHNMKNGSMFGQLRKYKDGSYCSENPYFYIYTPNGICSTYQIFSVCVVKDPSDSFIKDYPNDEAFVDYISYIRGLSYYPVDVDVTEESKIVTLSTCTNVRDDERLLVHAVKIGEEMIEE